MKNERKLLATACLIKNEGKLLATAHRESSLEREVSIGGSLPITTNHRDAPIVGRKKNEDEGESKHCSLEEKANACTRRQRRSRKSTSFLSLPISSLLSGMWAKAIFFYFEKIGRTHRSCSLMMVL